MVCLSRSLLCFTKRLFFSCLKYKKISFLIKMQLLLEGCLFSYTSYWKVEGVNAKI